MFALRLHFFGPSGWSSLNAPYRFKRRSVEPCLGTTGPLGFKKGCVSKAVPEAGFLVEGLEIRADAGTGLDFCGSFARAAPPGFAVHEPVGVHRVAALHQIMAEGDLPRIESSGRSLGARQGGRPELQRWVSWGDK